MRGEGPAPCWWKDVIHLGEACLFVPEKAALAAAWKARRDEIFDELDRLNNKARAVSGGAVRVLARTP